MLSVCAFHFLFCFNGLVSGSVCLIFLFFFGCGMLDRDFWGLRKCALGFCSFDSASLA